MAVMPVWFRGVQSQFGEEFKGFLVEYLSLQSSNISDNSSDGSNSSGLQRLDSSQGSINSLGSHNLHNHDLSKRTICDPPTNCTTYIPLVILIGTIISIIILGIWICYSYRSNSPSKTDRFSDFKPVKVFFKSIFGSGSKKVSRMGNQRGFGRWGRKGKRTQRDLDLERDGVGREHELMVIKVPKGRTWRRENGGAMIAGSSGQFERVGMEDWEVTDFEGESEESEQYEPARAGWEWGNVRRNLTL